MENSGYSKTMELFLALERGYDEHRIIQALRTCIAEYKNENDIVLEYFDLGSNEAIRLASALTNGDLPHIRKMQLNNNLIEEDGIIAIAEALPHCSIGTLILTSNDIGNEGAIAIARALPDASELTTLDITNCQLTIDGVIAIVEALPHCNISDLYLSENDIGNEGAFAIANALKHESCQLTNLKLLDSDISKTGNDELLKALKVNIQLEKLELFPKNSVLSDENNTLEYNIAVQTGINRAIKHTFKKYKRFSAINETSKVLGPEEKDRLSDVLSDEIHQLLQDDKYDAFYPSTINNIEELSKFINFMSEQLHLAKRPLEPVKYPSELLEKKLQNIKWIKENIPSCIQKIKRRILFLKRNKTVAQLNERVQNALYNDVQQQQINNIGRAIYNIQLRLNQLSKQQMQIQTTPSSHHQSSSSSSSSSSKKRTFSKMSQP